MANPYLAEAGKEKPLSDYSGKVVLVVNTASKCGFTPQFEGLEKLYKGLKEKHGDDFVILGFPCNQFGGQGACHPRSVVPWRHVDAPWCDLFCHDH